MPDPTHGPLRMRPGLTPQISRNSKLRGRRGKPYRPSDGLLAAVNVALKLQRPLLLTGEPGCGKTDFAYACASALGEILGLPAEQRALLSCSVRSDTRARDLLYTHDAVRRFGDAQFSGDMGQARAQDPRHYITLDPLGEALCSAVRRVVLIDEIDKAPRDLPNDLLQELDQGHFTLQEVPEPPPTAESILFRETPLRRRMARPLDPHGEPVPLPLIILTSNVENQLPDAFLRRCIFWDIAFPADEELKLIVLDHFPDQPGFGGLQRRQALHVHRTLRGMTGLAKKPATAELLDWLTALTQVLHHEDVASRLEAAAAGRLPWRELPALSCLVKLREDLQLLERRA